jgi:adenylate kinase
MTYFETGAELRRLSKEDSDLGKKVKGIIEAGRLVPNEVVMDIVEDFLNKINEGESVIFDGIPRKMVQAETLDALLKKNDREYKTVIIDISQELAITRLTQRRICSSCKEVYSIKYEKNECEKCGGNLETRADDNEKSIKIRINAYFEETMPVIEMYEKEGNLIRINGELELEEVSNELFQNLDPLLK